MLVAEAERRLRLIERLASAIDDERDPLKVRHEIEEMLTQRILGIACGCEDCNDFDDLRHDPALKVAVGRLPRTGNDLASQPTLSRLENPVGRGELYRMSQVLVDLFVEGREESPAWVVIDVDGAEGPGACGRGPRGRRHAGDAARHLRHDHAADRRRDGAREDA